MIAILSGGTGTPKLLQGLKQILPQSEIAVLVNTAEDCWLPHGYFSPDVDTVLYTFANLIDDEVWHGIKNDTFYTHEALLELGFEEFLKIGDKDRAMHIARGEMLKHMKLCEAIDLQRQALGVNARVIPMCDDAIETIIKTPRGEMQFHEFWVKNKGRPKVLDVCYRGIEKAHACEEAVAAVEEAEAVIIGPSNPVSSVLPIISLREIREALLKKKGRAIAVSPIAAGAPFSGPADKFMRAKGIEVSSLAVAQLYRDLINYFVIDSKDDKKNTPKIQKLGIRCLATNTHMRSLRDKKALAKFVLRALE